MGNKHPRYDDDFYDWIISQGADVNNAWAVCERMQDAWRARAAKLTHQPEFNKTAMLGTCCENGDFNRPHDCMKQKADDQPDECIPLPREECERIRKLDIRKNEDGTYSYSSSGLLPNHDVWEAINGLDEICDVTASDLNHLIKLLEPVESANSRVRSALKLLRALRPTKRESQPDGISKSVLLSLKAAHSLTKKYTFLVGEQKIGDKEITELREAHYQVGNAIYDLEKLPERESQPHECGNPCRYKKALETAHKVFGAECDKMQKSTTREVSNFKWDYRDEAINLLQAQKDAMLAENLWQPVETAPEDTFVLAYGNDDLCGWINGIKIGVAKHKTNIWWNNEAEMIISPLFWKPLPKPPTTDVED